jgi:hypothetical protein
VQIIWQSKGAKTMVTELSPAMRSHRAVRILAIGAEAVQQRLAHAWREFGLLAEEDVPEELGANLVSIRLRMQNVSPHADEHTIWCAVRHMDQESAVELAALIADFDDALGRT